MATQKQIDSLPAWAKKAFENDQATINRLKNKIDRIETTAAIMTGREWFTIHNPSNDGETLSLWAFADRNQPFCVCTIGKGDVLVVGSEKKKSSQLAAIE